MKEWNNIKLKNIIAKIIDNRGKSAPISDNGIYPIIEINAIGGFYPDYSKIRKYVSTDIYNSWFRAGHPEENDILIPTVGTIGITSMMDKTQACIAQNLIALRLRPDVNPLYVYYFLKSDYTKQHLINLNIGGVQPSIKVPHLLELSIPLPKLKVQNAIANILHSIDQKIELNRQINDNLEQQAQALYKSWFVNFEPFKDCEFVDSELGLIPEGWQVGTYEQIIQTTISGDWGKDIITGNYTHKVACVRGCDFQDMSIGVRGKTPERYILEKNYQAKRLIDNDVIVEISGGTSTISTGRVCLINDDLLGKYNNDIVCTNFCKVVRPIQSYGAYLYYSWKYKYDCRVMFAYENGTSGIKNFQISDFLSKEPVIIPSESNIKEFQTIIDTLQNNIQTNGSEIMKLESLRDSLLPKLMSGELKINEIDC